MIRNCSISDLWMDGKYSCRKQEWKKANTIIVAGVLKDRTLLTLRRTFIRLVRLSETAGFTLGFHQAQDVAFTDRSDNVADHRAVLADESNANLSNTTAGSGSAKAAVNFGKGNRFFLIIRKCSKQRNIEYRYEGWTSSWKEDVPFASSL